MAFAAQLRAQLDAIHVRHHHVEHDEVEVPVAYSRETREPVVCRFGRIALGLEVLANAGREMRLVVHDQDVGAARWERFAHNPLSGQRIVTVAPRPGPSLRALMVPPDSSTSRLTMYSPSPVPGIERRSSSPIL